MIIPPFAGIRLVEYRDRIELTPVYACRDIVGLGKINADAVRRFPAGELPIFDEIVGNKEVWVIVNWRRYDDGREEAVNMECLDPEATEQEARKEFQRWNEFLRISEKERESLAECIGLDEGRIVNPPDRKSVEQDDVYRARLKALAGMMPKTAALVQKALTSEEPAMRQRLEKQAVQAFFAELAHYWTEEMVLDWQRSNPVGTAWMCEFCSVLQEPKREMDPINYELALNWIRRGYNLMTAEELSDAVLVATGQRLTPETIKKRRERLGLTTKRPPGRHPNCQ